MYTRFQPLLTRSEALMERHFLIFSFDKSRMVALLSVCLACLSAVCLSAVCLSVCLSVCLCVSVSVCLCLCLSVLSVAASHVAAFYTKESASHLLENSADMSISPSLASGQPKPRMTMISSVGWNFIQEAGSR